MQDGFIEFDIKNDKRHYIITDKGIKSNYFIYGDIHSNGYTKNQILVTPLGMDRYKEITTHISNFISLDMLCHNNYNMLYVPDEYYNKFQK